MADPTVRMTITITINTDDTVATAIDGKPVTTIVRSPGGYKGTRKHTDDVEALVAAVDGGIDDDAAEEVLDQLHEAGFALLRALTY